MAQAIHAAGESLYYEATNASNYAGIHVESPVAAGFLHSRAVWALGLLVALAITRMITSKPKMPAGTKALPQIPGLPYIGAPWGVPVPGAESAWHFADLHKKYGPIYAWEVFGTYHVWVESDKIARDLLVHRGKKYGGRHEIPAAVGVKDGSEFVPLMNIGDNFWRHKNFIHALNRQANADNIFFGYPSLRTRTPSAGYSITQTSGQSISLRTAPVSPVESPGETQDMAPNSYMSFPPWKKAEAKRAQQMKDGFYEAQEDVIKRYEEGTAEGSWTKLWLDKAQGLEKSHLNKHEAAHAVGSNALVAIVTIGSPVHTFFTAMCHYPSWLPRLQEEVDRVCGDRLPLMTDMPKLPVLRAVVKEPLRWRQPTPLGVPHILEEDDVYEGYFMPKGAMIHANHYLISREPTQFPEADEWRPERWLDPSWPTYKEPLSEFPTVRGDPGFGYGVRACPGIDLVATELYTTIGSIAWGFNIKRKEGKAGYENPVPWYQTNPYVITMASQFPADVTPRSADKARIIRQLTEDPSLTVKGVGEKSEGQFGRWDVYRPEEGSGKTFDWEGLTALAPDHDKGPRRYPAGV
ncbi:hypothetical protein B0A54_11974 [Friedmanniomyces endolithicus]|uniref:Cytochrome P450 n=1 Tax=Friedmanniomyces endolithicus TaxID=329885 RepID=A0A4U0UN20_9PEZI|nr:hypothetical protein B0A54_11974 [Friedmanniomyces endolithicus]